MIRLAAICACALLLNCVAQASAAQVLRLPSHAQTITENTAFPDSYALPTGPFGDGHLPERVVEGRVTRQTWRIPTQGITTLQILAPLRTQLDEAGYEVLFECDTRACGGFDFRFETEVLPPPDMYVNLADFRFLSAQIGNQSHIGLLVSRSENSGFVQLIHVARAGTPPSSVARPDPDDAPQEPANAQETPEAQSLAQAIQQNGHVVLSDLTFDTGSSDLGQGDFSSLAALADFLAADPARRVVLVGHTDTVGALDRNIDLSRARAASVLERMVTLYNIDRTQLAAEGAGYLAPRASNATKAGRDANRRVEAVLLGTP
ncbi:MAG: OmpA family protein [Sediminimonas qiaohouensis]|uniref:OmpA family protein n=1 Tax=Sediminimonas qiaohouensis TaxID=552061 RepID=A0A7C9HB87_9RHOB|nr:OmpA family protein [Sediminimonas qiaohouensis]MTJ05006.1 OmpA family protein [Sediminimonas qiaohouensis]